MTKHQKIAWWILLTCNTLAFLISLFQLIQTPSISQLLLLPVHPAMIFFAYLAYRKQNRPISCILTALLLSSCSFSLFRNIFNADSLPQELPLSFRISTSIFLCIMMLFLGYVFIRALLATFRFHKKLPT